MKKSFLVSFFVTLIFSFRFIFAIADWTVLVYANADNDLPEFLEDDLVEMFDAVDFAGDSSRVNILVQGDWPPFGWHTADWYPYSSDYYVFNFWLSGWIGWSHPSSDLGSFQYRIYHDGFGAYIDYPNIISKMGHNVVEELVDGMQWAVSNYPAQHYMLVLWGHSRGIQDPSHSDWVRSPRSILFDDTQETYMNNQQMIQALSRIKTTVMEGRKIDILGMDACFPSGIEMAYQIRDYADFFVSNEASGPAYGWDYYEVLYAMLENYMSPVQVANYIVSTFQEFYRDYLGYEFYTHAATDLSKIDPIIQNLNEVVSYIDEFRNLNLIEINDFRITSAVTLSRFYAQEFQLVYFIDLYTFYSDLSENLANYPKTAQNPSDELGPHSRRPIWPEPDRIRRRKFARRVTEGEEKVAILRKALTEGMTLIEDAVIANVHGTEFPRAKGLSGYFPKDEIHFSYPLTEFAQNCSWYDFLQYYVPKV